MTGFARYLGVKQPTLNRWMSGDNPPDGDNLQKLADKLGYEIYVIAGVIPPSPIVRKLHEAQAAYDALPPDRQQAFIDRINKIIEDTYSDFNWKRKK